MNLQDFVHLPHRFEWGGSGRYDRDGRMLNDCTTVCASWVEMLTGVDPAAHLRGTYHDADGAKALIGAAGGHVAFMALHLQPIGYTRVDEPQDGDIGVVIAPVGMEGNFKEIGAIRFGPLWATLSGRGMVAKRLDPVAVWRLA